MTILKQLEDFCYKPISFLQGSKLIQEDQGCDQVYVLISGTLKVTTGNVVIGNFNKKGDTFGEMAAIMNQNASATVEALEDSQVYVINDIDAFLTKNPQHCVNMLKMSYNRLKQMNNGVNIMWEHINLD
jgi:CRP-like cAMP-binding protein